MPLHKPITEDHLVPQDEDIFPFGRYKISQTPYGEVPCQYLDWISGQSWIKEWPAVISYIEKYRKYIDHELGMTEK